MYVLGLNLGHDAGTALVSDGRIVAAAAEERFLRIKHANTWPLNALEFCLSSGRISIQDVEAIAVTASPELMPDIQAFFGQQEHPLAHRIYEKLYANGSSPAVVQFFPRLARRILREMFPISTLSFPVYAPLFKAREGAEIVRIDHHLAHAASAYYTSGFQERCLVITSDGIGDGTSTSVWIGDQGKLRNLMRAGAEGSLGWAYGAATEALGWQVNEGEGKTMGLAPYGTTEHTGGTLDRLFPCYRGGSVETPHDFGRVTGWFVNSVHHWHFPDAAWIKELTTRYGDAQIAAEAQRILEEQLLRLVLPWVERTGLRRLAAAGGVFLNVKANQRLLESGKLDDFHIFPDAGDSGIAAGAALHTWFQRSGSTQPHTLEGVFFGPSYSSAQIEAVLKERGISYQTCPDIAREVSHLLAQGKIVGWFQGRMEVGPRALGGRSILMDPRRPENKDIINRRVKFREPFRPFCPSLPNEVRDEYLVGAREAPYMIISFDVKEGKSAQIPAVVHVDNTARPQTVIKEHSEIFWHLLNQFGEATGIPVLLNTSFNIRGEPIVCSPRDAIKCFFDTGLDYLAVGDFLIGKNS